MKDTGKQEHGKLVQVAQELHRLADSIGRGKVQVSGVDLIISDSVTLKVKQKMTGKKVVFDLKIQALLEADRGAQKVKTTKKKSGQGGSRPYAMKALKKKYTAVWRILTTQIKKGEKPDATVVQELKTLSAEYAESAPPEWVAIWRESEVLIDQCIASAEDNDFVGARDLLGEINKVKKNCHKVYK